MRSHGTGIACYRGHRPKTGTCVLCRLGAAINNRKALTRYNGTARGMLRRARYDAKQRSAR